MKKIYLLILAASITQIGIAQVKTINNLKNDIKIVGGGQIKITPQGNTLTISSTAENESGGYWAKDGNNLSNSNEGNIGIGTKSPISPLHVEGSGITISRNGFGNPFSLSKDASAPFGIFEGGSVNNYRMVIKEGNIGIGVTNPDMKLHVNGDVLIQDGSGLFFGRGHTDPNYSLRIYSAPDEWGMRLNGFSGVRLSTGQGDILNVFHDKVGIGTTAPNSKLDVRGELRAATINASEITSLELKTQNLNVLGTIKIGDITLKPVERGGIYKYGPEPILIELEGMTVSNIFSLNILVICKTYLNGRLTKCGRMNNISAYPPGYGVTGYEYSYSLYYDKVSGKTYIKITSQALELHDWSINISILQRVYNSN